jgi:hypothetical protein
MRKYMGGPINVNIIIKTRRIKVQKGKWLFMVWASMESRGHRLGWEKQDWIEKGKWDPRNEVGS